MTLHQQITLHKQTLDSKIVDFWKVHGLVAVGGATRKDGRDEMIEDTCVAGVLKRGTGSPELRNKAGFIALDDAVGPHLNITRASYSVMLYSQVILPSASRPSHP